MGKNLKYLNFSNLTKLLVLIALVISFTTYFFYTTNFLKIFQKTEDKFSNLQIRQTTEDFNKIHYFLTESIDLAVEHRKVEIVEYQKQQLKEFQINRMTEIMRRYNSPMAGYAKVMYEQSEKCGGNYKVLFAIAGNESGFGRVPYKLYNPFGYLDGVQYSGWEESITYLSCKISSQHISKCGENLNCLVNRYGGSDTNKEKWIKNISWFMGLL